MIDPLAWAKGMTLLQERFNRDVSQGTLDAYHLLLQDLTTEEFSRAVSVIYNGDEFWPTPQRFKDIARGERSDAPHRAWLAMLPTVEAGGVPDDPLTRRALDDVGGPTRVALAPDDYTLDRLRRRFEEAYRARVERDEPLPDLLAGPPRLGGGS